MKNTSSALHHLNWTFFLQAVLICFTFNSLAHAGTTDCTVAFNRTVSLMNQGGASMCRNQQQMLDALDAAAIACAGVMPNDFRGMKSQFMGATRGCHSAGFETSVGSTSERSLPPDENKTLVNARADGEKAAQFMKDMKKCEQINDPVPSATCRKIAAQNYQANISGSVFSSYSNNPSGGVSISNNPEEKHNQQPKALMQPKDPDVDYSGKSCSFFTKPAEEEGRLNYYAKGSCVSYGKSSYECNDKGRWQLRGPASAFRCKTAQELENSQWEHLKSPDTKNN